MVERQRGRKAERQEGRKVERQKGGYQDSCAFFIRLAPHPRQYLAVTEVKAIWQQGWGCTNKFPFPLLNWKKKPKIQKTKKTYRIQA